MKDQPDADRPKHAVILCHPDERSFNRSIADAYCDAVQKLGQQFVLRDLYRMDFDPVLKAHERTTGTEFTPSPDVERELALLGGCDVFTLVYPIWFGTPPAMMKGYVERVLGSGVTPHAVEARARTPLLGGKRLLSFTTSAMSDPWLNEQGQWMSLRYIFDHYLAHAFGMLGDNHVHFANVRPGMELRWAEQHLYEVEQQARQTCAIALDDRRKCAGADAVPAQ